MTLNELKEPYESNRDKKLDKYSCTEVADKYLSSSSVMEKNSCISYLICESWNLLNKIYYQNNNNILSIEECYDIYIQTLHYVLSTHPWTKEESSLHEDDKAFEKAMAITIQSRRKNFLAAKFRQKRVANTGSISLDGLEEDFQDGFFSPHEDDYSEMEMPLVNQRIKKLFEEKKYLASFILEAILYNNVFTDEHELDMRKLRKYLRNIDHEFCRYFTDKYKLNLEEVEHSLIYFKDNPQDKLDAKIQYAFIILKNDDIIKQILNR